MIFWSHKRHKGRQKSRTLENEQKQQRVKHNAKNKSQDKKLSCCREAARYFI